ncbi:MAG TPA: LysM peptidoglycan-binding domain-containing protein [Vicinamibacterales bacterium]|nr:LysM peptidoglycan-binding domain-containing protein [Vicinamibacterales bacterium]
MPGRAGALLPVFALAAVWVTGCAPATVADPPVLAPAVAEEPASPLPPAQSPPPEQDAAQDLVTRSQAAFEEGQAELRLGHLDRAKARFDEALDLLLQSPGGARADSRVREHFDRLVDRISAYELRALAEGDGFAERPTVPASLDELLELVTFDLPTPPTDLREAVELDLKSTVHDVLIPAHPKVLSYVDLFQGRLREWFQAALDRGAAYLPMIQASLRAEGLPLDLAYLPIIESAFRTEALSRAKAKGFWQLMRGTAVELGLKHDWYIDERSSPEKSTAAAVRYLKALNRQFKGDWYLTLASYNGGPGKVQRIVTRRGVADFWRLADLRRVLPRETREYVPMALAAMVIGRNPGQYGFSRADARLEPSDSVVVTGPVDLRRIAEWAGVSADEIQRLNPELRRWTTPMRQAPYALRVPAGTGAAIDARLAEAAAEDLTAVQWYTVRRGETLQSVANKLKVRRADLAEANYLSPRAKVRLGQRLVIPRDPTTLLAARPGRADSAARGLEPGMARAVAPEPGGILEPVVYCVKRGDTLSSIARAFHTTVAALRSWNRLTSDRLMPGDRLTVSGARSGAD